MLAQSMLDSATSRTFDGIDIETPGRIVNRAGNETLIPRIVGDMHASTR